MNDIHENYNLLDEPSKKMVRAFIHGLLSKKKAATSEMKTYRKNLLKVSQWSDEDIATMDENRKLLDAWKLRE